MFLSEIDVLFCSPWIFCHFTCSAHHSFLQAEIMNLLWHMIAFCWSIKCGWSWLLLIWN